MTTLFSARFRMPHAASAIAPAPLALGVAAEPCTPAKPGGDIGGIIRRALGGGHRDANGGRRFGGVAQSNGSTWYRQDSAQLAGGGPLRG